MTRSTIGDDVALLQAALRDMRTHDEDDRMRLECQECGQPFRDSSMDPECPCCGSYDIDLAYQRR